MKGQDEIQDPLKQNHESRQERNEMVNESNKCLNCAKRTFKEILIQALIEEKEETIINERN